MKWIDIKEFNSLNALPAPTYGLQAGPPFCPPTRKQPFLIGLLFSNWPSRFSASKRSSAMLKGVYSISSNVPQLWMFEPQSAQADALR
jgi:hypothetical protein